MLVENPPAPVARLGVTVYAPPAAVVADNPAAFGVNVTPVTLSPLASVPLTLKFVLLVPAVSAVPYVFAGPVAVTVNAAGFTVKVPVLYVIV